MSRQRADSIGNLGMGLSGGTECGMKSSQNGVDDYEALDTGYYHRIFRLLVQFSDLYNAL